MDKNGFSVVEMLGAVLTEKGVMGWVDVAASSLGPDLALLSSLFNHKRVCVSVDVDSWGLYIFNSYFSSQIGNLKYSS